MRKIVIVALIGLGIFTACSKKKTIKAVDDDLTQGTWKVTLYEEDGVNETSDYSAYVFSFKTDGSIVATLSSTSISGTWATDKDDDHVDFTLNLPVPLDGLSDDWEIQNNSSTKLELKDISGDGTLEYLTFEKI